MVLRLDFSGLKLAQHIRFLPKTALFLGTLSEIVACWFGFWLFWLKSRAFVLLDGES
jgi:hypothetical protein